MNYLIFHLELLNQAEKDGEKNIIPACHVKIHEQCLES